MISLAGCDKDKSPESPKPYDPKVDAPASPVVVGSDPGLLQDQTTLSAQIRGAKSAAAPTPGSQRAAKPAEGAPADASAAQSLTSVVPAKETLAAFQHIITLMVPSPTAEEKQAIEILFRLFSSTTETPESMPASDRKIVEGFAKKASSKSQVTIKLDDKNMSEADKKEAAEFMMVVMEGITAEKADPKGFAKIKQIMDSFKLKTGPEKSEGAPAGTPEKPATGGEPSTAPSDAATPTATPAASPEKPATDAAPAAPAKPANPAAPPKD
jgi:hypothetical protein